MSASSRVVSHPPRSSSTPQSSRTNRTQPQTKASAASTQLPARKTKSVPVPLTTASRAKSVRAKTPVEVKPVAADTASKTSNLNSPSVNAPKVKRTRVPTDLAERYGENRKERKVVEAPPVAEKKARKTAEQREKLRQLMTPDDDILQRLARAASGSSRPAPRQKKATRSKSEWESRCGKCGITATFSTPAALCTKCGAITVRVLD